MTNVTEPKEYRWTTYKFYCTDCEAPRYASVEALESYVHSEVPDFEEDIHSFADEIIAQPIEQWDEYLGEGQVDAIVSCFSFCLACAYGPEDWAKECSNPEGEKVIA